MFNLTEIKNRIRDAFIESVTDTPDEEVLSGELPPTLMRMRDFYAENAFHDLLPYESYDPDLGLFFNESGYGMAFAFEPLVGERKPADRAIAAISELGFPVDTTIQVVAPGLGDDADRLASEVRAFISISIPGHDPDEKEEAWVAEIAGTVEEILAKAGLLPQRLDPVGLISVARAVLVPTQPVNPISYDENTMLREQVPGGDFDFAIGPKGLVLNGATARLYTVVRRPKPIRLPDRRSILGDGLTSGRQVVCMGLRLAGDEEGDSELDQVTLSVLLISHPETADRNEQITLDMWKRERWLLSRDAVMQDQGVIAALPFGYDHHLAEDFRASGRSRELRRRRAIRLAPLDDPAHPINRGRDNNAQH